MPCFPSEFFHCLSSFLSAFQWFTSNTIMSSASRNTLTSSSSNFYVSDLPCLIAMVNATSTMLKLVGICALFLILNSSSICTLRKKLSLGQRLRVRDKERVPFYHINIIAINSLFFLFSASIRKKAHNFFTHIESNFHSTDKFHRPWFIILILWGWILFANILLSIFVSVLVGGIAL